jgi:hypothetical protein
VPGRARHAHRVLREAAGAQRPVDIDGDPRLRAAPRRRQGALEREHEARSPSPVLNVPRGILARFEEIVLEISRDEELCWFAVLYLHDLLRHAPRNDVSAYVDIQTLVDQVLANVIDHRESLCREYRWVGSELCAFSVWAYVSNLVEAFSREYPYDFKASSFR